MLNTEKKRKDWRRKAVKRVKRIAIYLTEAEYVLVQESARKAGLDFSSYIRGMTLKGYVNSRLSEEEKVIFRELVIISNELHELVKMAREKGLPQTLLHFETCRSRLDGLFKKFKL